MIHLFLLFLLVNIINSIYRRAKGLKINTLCCGLFGYAGSEPPEMNKIKILGILNEYRGIHSCGVYYDNMLKKGVDKEAIFTNFIVKNPVFSVPNSNILIGHTRHATVGSHTEANAHPFLIDNKFVLAHNGTISNIWELCHKYGIDSKDIYVDSLALGHLIMKEGFKVLNEYKGFAALLMHDKEEENTLKIYHGSSQRKPGEKQEEERPLYYLKLKNGFYFSSLGYSLDAIKDSVEDEVKVVPHNTVITIRNGHIDNNENVIVDRGTINVEYPPPAIIRNFNQPSKDGYSNYYPKQEKKEEKKEIKSLIWSENEPNRAYDYDVDCVYFWKGRYWETKSVGMAATQELCQGIYYLNKAGEIMNTLEGNKSYYFHKGVAIKTWEDFEKLRDDKFLQEKLKTLNFAAVISRYSKYPVTNLEDEAVLIPDCLRFAWFKDCRVEKSGFTPKFSNRSYTFREGILLKIECSDKKELPLLIPDYLLNKEEVLEELADQHNYFNQIFWSPTLALSKLDKIGRAAMRSYLRDVDFENGREDIAPNAEVDKKIDSLIWDATAANVSILNKLPKGGNFLTYLEEALEKESEIPSEEAEVIANEVEIDTYTEIVQEELFPLPEKIKDPCIACEGSGTSSVGEACIPCEGSGEIKKKDNQNHSEYVQQEEEAAKRILENLAVELKNIDEVVGDLEVLFSSEVAIESSLAIFTSSEDIKKKIKEILLRHNLSELAEQFNTKNILTC